MSQKPAWLKIRPPKERFHDVKKIVSFYGLNTVCQEAHCPNMSECWTGGTATFMIMGDTCTRGCRFCAVNTGRPDDLDPLEPKKLAAAIKQMKMLDYVVLTSVDRDDLEDEGASHFAACVEEIKKGDTMVEVLTPDFSGREELIKIVVDAGPDVFAHNVETVERLQNIRDFRAGYEQSIDVLKIAKRLNPEVYTKSSLMLGLGEKDDEVIQTMEDLKEADVDIITFGQYLKPKTKRLKVEKFVTPEKFKYFKKVAQDMGFLYCASGPFIRSSYRAGELFLKNLKGA